jgi:lysine 2,3-aminomutase
MALIQPIDESTYDVRFSGSGEMSRVDHAELVAAIADFLEHCCGPPLVDREFMAVVGPGDGMARFSRLLRAAGYETDAPGFLRVLLDRLSGAAGGQSGSVEVNGQPIPYHLLLAVLGELIPGDDILDVKSVRRLERLTNTTVPPAEKAALKEVLDTYPVRFSSHTVRQMRLSANVAFQYMPFVEELDDAGLDHTWVGQFHRGIVEQMYRNRVIFVLNMTCPVYCRFCFRKHKECRHQKSPTQDHVKQAVAYVKSSPDVREVVLTGGDPFMNRPTLTMAIDGLRDIGHVRVLRLATRALSYHPALFAHRDGFWLDYLRRKQIELEQKGKRLEVATHFIHPDEVTRESLEVITELVNAGVQVYVQTPFLASCNDRGEVLAELFAMLRGAGAEMHYIFMPCSPIRGNSVYWAPLSDGVQAARTMRATLSDRAVPHLCTATALGKVEWGTSGWVVEQDPTDDRYLWLRTPYTPEYYESFAPILQLSDVARVNAEGTFDARFMATVGDPDLLAGPMAPVHAESDPAPVSSDLGTPEFPVNQLISEVRHGFRLGGALLPSIGETGVPGLRRLHHTRMEIRCDGDDDAVRQGVQLIAESPSVTDVVVVAASDVLDSLARAVSLIKAMHRIDHVTAVRLRSLGLITDPQRWTRAVVRRLGDVNRLSVVEPTRVEVETMVVYSGELGDGVAGAVRALRRRGITAYADVAVLRGVNDTPEEMLALATACRRVGLELHHAVVAGLPVQASWNAERPISLGEVIGIASFLRANGSGRELPTYVVATAIGELDVGLDCQLTASDDDGTTRIAARAFDRELFQTFWANGAIPADLTFAPDGAPILSVEGLVP